MFSLMTRVTERLHLAGSFNDSLSMKDSVDQSS